ncbi:hypothetical protein BC2230_120090 [Burkholderia cepacia]
MMVIPSQLLQDAKRHGVKVLPVDVSVSAWDSAIEGPKTSAPVLTAARHRAQ